MLINHCIVYCATSLLMEALCCALCVGKYVQTRCKINGLNPMLIMMIQPRRTSRNEMLQIQIQIILHPFAKSLNYVIAVLL